jgi:non-specific protein-tyrosine kinase
LELDLSTLTRLARRWWWLLLLGPLVAAATAYWSASRQDPLYSATATLMINQAQDPGQQDLSGLQAGERLGATYQRLVATDPVLTATIANLGLPLTPNQLRGKVSATAVTGTQLLRISVSDTSPQQAAAIANGVAAEFARFIAAAGAQLSNVSREALAQQIADTQLRIDELTAQIQELEQGPTGADPNVQVQIAGLRTSLNQFQASYGELLVRSQEMDLNEAAIQHRVTVVEDARVPGAPYAPRTTLYVVLGALAGLLIAAAAVVLLGYLDNTVKPETDFAALTGGPLLSAVNRLPKLKPGKEQLFVVDQPVSSAAEAVRLLRVNLEFAAATKEIATLAVTSAGPGEGKSTVTANLAIALAQAGFSTAVVDADLRRPSQHTIFGVRAERGLTSLLVHPDQPWRWAAVEVGVPNLLLIPSGPLPPNPSDLLTLDRFQRLMTTLQEEADIVLIDTPPVLAVSDPLVVAAKVDAVALVAYAGRTRVEALRRAAEALHQGSARVIGVVLNRQSGRAGVGYYYEGYYGPAQPPQPPQSPAPPVGGLAAPARQPQPGR